MPYASRMSRTPPPPPRVVLGAVLLGLAIAPPAAAQVDSPLWVHVTPSLGIVARSVPGDGWRPAAALQLEISRDLPMGPGITAGYAWPSRDRDARELAGPWAEATFAYRFRLRFRGYLAPYAGPLLGGALHDLDAPGAPPGEGRWLFRWHFGGRAGMDIPVGGGWPAVRVEATYRHTASAGGLGSSDTATALIGFRWSRPLP